MNKIMISVEFAGSYIIADGMITVTGPNGKEKTAEIGGAPVEKLAKFVLAKIVHEAMFREADGLETVEVERKDH